MKNMNGIKKQKLPVTKIVAEYKVQHRWNIVHNTVVTMYGARWY